MDSGQTNLTGFLLKTGSDDTEGWWGMRDPGALCSMSSAGFHKEVHRRACEKVQDLTGVWLSDSLHQAPHPVTDCPHLPPFRAGCLTGGLALGKGQGLCPLPKVCLISRGREE